MIASAKIEKKCLIQSKYYECAYKASNLNIWKHGSWFAGEYFERRMIKFLHFAVGVAKDAWRFYSICHKQMNHLISLFVETTGTI